MIRLNVFVKAARGQANDVQAGLDELAAQSRAEAGCLGYDLFRSTVDPDLFIIIESWASDAALETHKLTRHYTTLLPAIGRIATLKLERFEAK